MIAQWPASYNRIETVQEGFYTSLQPNFSDMFPPQAYKIIDLCVKSFSVIGGCLEDIQKHLDDTFSIPARPSYEGPSPSDENGS